MVDGDKVKALHYWIGLVTLSSLVSIIHVLVIGHIPSIMSVITLFSVVGLVYTSRHDGEDDVVQRNNTVPLRSRMYWSSINF